MLLNLPVELVVQSLLFLHPRYILRCAQTCSALHAVVSTSIELRYAVELAYDGMDDPTLGHGVSVGPTALSNPAISDRLHRLRALRHNWETLSWTAAHTVPIGGRCTAYELVGGMLAKSDGMPLDDSLQCFWLPSAGDDAYSPKATAEGAGTVTNCGVEQPRVLSWPNNNPSMRDFAIDPSQDLLTLMQEDVKRDPEHLVVHVRTVSTDKPHPNAAVPVLRHPFRHREHPLNSVVIQIVDEVVGLFYTTHGSHRLHLLFWNWRTGNVILCPHTMSVPSGVRDWSFISNRGFIFVRITNDNPLSRLPGSAAEILVYRFSTDTDPPPLRSFIQSNTTPTDEEPAHPHRPVRASPPAPCCSPSTALPPLHTATLGFPSLRSGARYQLLRTHTGPFTARPDRGLPFMPCRAGQLHVMFLQVQTMGSPHTPGLVRASASANASAGESDDAEEEEGEEGEEGEEDDEDEDEEDEDLHPVVDPADAPGASVPIIRQCALFVKNETFLRLLDVGRPPSASASASWSADRMHRESDSEDSEAEAEGLLDEYEGRRPFRARTLKWHQWGPSETRWQQGLMHPPWLRYVHGQRAVFYYVPRRSTNRTPVLMIYDFNAAPTSASQPQRQRQPHPHPNPERKTPPAPRTPTRSSTRPKAHPPSARVPAAKSELRADVVTEQTTSRAGDFFVQDIATRLPYRVMRKRCDIAGFGTRAGILVDAERIVALEMDLDYPDMNSWIKGCTTLTF